MTDAWSECLTALQACLQEQRRALDEGRPGDIVPFAPAADLGPLPEALAPRARRLVDETHELEARLALLTAARARQLQLVTTLDRALPDRPSFVDARG